jgi:hypothetical protein
MGKGMCALMAVVVGACGTAGEGAAPAPGPETVSRVYTPGGGGAQMYNDPGVAARRVPAPMDSVLLTLPRVYEMLGVPDHGVNPEGNLYGNRSFRARRIEGKRLSNYIDCGQGLTAVPNADNYQVTMMVVTSLARAEDGGTTVTTTVDATGRSREVSTNPVHCQSKGELEMRVAQLVMWVLLGGEGKR